MEKKKRDLSIDFVRTTAIILMVFAHANMILRIESNPINNFLQNLGNTLCFALFLFCAGASAYYSTQKNPPSFNKSIKKIGLIYFTYIIISILNLIESKDLSVIPLLEYLTFLKLPSYAEFLAAFILFEVIFYFFYKPISFLAKNISLTLLCSVIFFSIGFSLKAVDFGSGNFIATLLFGREGIYSFPIFQYSLFFFLGTYYGHAKRETKLTLKNFLNITTLASIVIVMLLYLTNGLSFDNTRWPPSTSFIMMNLLGLLVTLVLFYILRFFVRRSGEYKKSLTLLSTTPSSQALHVFYLHLIILYFLRWINIPSSFITPYIVLLSILALTFVIFYAEQKRKNRAASLETQSR